MYVFKLFWAPHGGWRPRQWLPRLAFLLLGLALAAGCACPTQVSYCKLAPKAQDDRGRIKFHLVKANLLFAKLAAKPAAAGEKTNKPAQPASGSVGDGNTPAQPAPRVVVPLVEMTQDVDPSQIGVSVALEADTRHTYSLEPANTLGCTTNLDVTYLDNTFVIKQLGVSVKDDRKAMIQTGASILTAALGASVGVPVLPNLFKGIPEGIRFPQAPLVKPPKLKAPFVIDTKAGDSGNVPRNPGWTYQLVWSEPPDGAMPAEKFFNTENEEKRRKVIVFSACRELAVVLTFTGAEPLVVVVKAADPDYVNTLLLPPKSKAVMHTMCGANVECAESSSAVNWDAAQEVITRARSILFEQKKEEKQ